jgi:hypothetical protein
VTVTVPPGSREWTHAGLLLGGMTVFVGAAAVFLPEPPSVKAGLASTFLLLSAGPLLAAHPRWLELFRAWVGRKTVRWWLGLAAVVALAPTYWAREDLGSLPWAALYVAVPLLITADRPRRPQALVRDFAIVLLLWLPLEFGLVPGELVALKLVALNTLLLLYVLERRLFEPGRLVPTRKIEWAWGVGVCVAFLLLAIPIGMLTGFAQPGLNRTPPVEQFLSLVLLFWLTALPEEALFRGTIQGLIEKVSRPWIALAVASVIFGLAHFPDWRYILLATLAGAAYGLAYLQTRNLAAPILTHFLVDAVWRVFFSGST